MNLNRRAFDMMMCSLVVVLLKIFEGMPIQWSLLWDFKDLVNCHFESGCLALGGVWSYCVGSPEVSQKSLESPPMSKPLSAGKIQN